MYELIEKIIKKAGEEKVDTGVAYDMLVAENTSHYTMLLLQM